MKNKIDVNRLLNYIDYLEINKYRISIEHREEQLLSYLNGLCRASKAIENIDKCNIILYALSISYNMPIDKVNHDFDFIYSKIRSIQNEK